MVEAMIICSRSTSWEQNLKGVFHWAESRQSPSRFFFRKWVVLMNIYWRNNQYILAAETVITNAACAAAAFIYIRHRHLRPLFRLLSKTFDLWRQFYVIVNHATRDRD